MPEVPRVRLPHPVAGTGDAAMAVVSAAIVPSILGAWTASGEVS